MVKEFNPSDIFDQLRESGLDPSIFNKIDEGGFPKAPNFLEWSVGPQFLNTSILPKQVEIGTKLFCDYCPDCSVPGYIDTLFDQTIGNIKNNIVFLEHGKCPSCSLTRFELLKTGKLLYRNELVGSCGQRCIPKDALVYSDRGIIEMSDVEVWDDLSHGHVAKKIDSGVLPSLRITTKFNYTLTGAKETHIVPVLRQDPEFHKMTAKMRSTRKFKKEIKIEHILMKDCQVGDLLLLHKANLWAKRPFEFEPFEFVPHKQAHNQKTFSFPTEVTPDLARLLGYMVADGDYCRKYNVRVVTSNEDTEADVKRCFLGVFGEEPKLDEARKFTYTDDYYKSWVLNGIEAVEWFRHIGLKPVTARDKEIPACILQSPKEIVCEFLAGLYGADGNIFNDQGNVRVQYSSVSKRLIKQVRVVLLNLGIVTRCDRNESPKFGKSIDYSVEAEEGKQSYFLATKDAKYVEIFRNNVKVVEKKKIATLAESHLSGHTEYHTPYGAFREYGYEKWHPSLQALVEQGYYPVPITKIEDGPDLDMADVMIPGTNLYTADSFINHNSGKSKLVAMLATYINHRYLKLASPMRTFNQSSGDMFLGTFSGLTMDQCNRNLWSPFRAFMDASPWFQKYHRFLKDQEKKLGVELYHDLQNSITYIHKNLHWYSTGSEARKMRGDTRIFAAIDELGWMNSDESKSDQTFMNADAVYTALVNSLTTIRTKYNNVFSADNYDLPPPIMANVSSPSSAKDKIMRLTKDASRNTRILAFNAPTWEMNPDFNYEDLREEFAHYDDLTFNRDFGAEPPLAANPFLSEPKLVDKIATGEEFKGFDVTLFTAKDNFDDTFKSARMNLKRGDKVIPRMATFDLGYRKNGLSICVFSLTPESKPKLDFAIAITPDPKLKIRVNVVDVFESFTMPLVTNFNIKHAFFDRWQSLDQIERLKILEVDAQMHSLTYKEMESVRGSIITQSVTIPRMEKPMTEYAKEYVDDKFVSQEGSAQLGIQLLTVRDMGHKMIKPLLGDDDIFRAFCLGVVKLSDPNIKKDYMEVVETKSGHRVACLGTLRFRSDESGMQHGGLGTVEGAEGRVLGTVRTRKN